MTPPSAAGSVTRLVNKIVWPLLKQRFFADFTSRNAWRNLGDAVDVVNFQSAVGKAGFPLFLGGGTEATLGSFSVNVGTYYAIRNALPWPSTAAAMVADGARPAEWECDERLRLEARIQQPEQYPTEIWQALVDDPSKLRAAIVDACGAIEEQALPWFESNHDFEKALLRLKPGCWHRATDLRREPDCFFRDEDLFAAFALKLGRVDEARRLFEAIASRKFDPYVREKYQKDELRRKARLARSKRPVVIYDIPFWHDGALARLASLKKSE